MGVLSIIAWGGWFTFIIGSFTILNRPNLNPRYTERREEIEKNQEENRKRIVDLQAD